MTPLRVLHVDDEPDIREVVELSLGLDSALAVKTCGSGQEALAAAPEWSPDLVLLDVMMPVMDGPTTLRRLREQEPTRDIPVVFMTARAQPHEIDSFIALGAIGVISKPFDPMTLAASVRRFATPSGVTASAKGGFAERMRRDGATLAALGVALDAHGPPLPTLQDIRSIAHGLAGAGAIFGHPDISTKAAALAEAAETMLETDGPATEVKAALDRLVAALTPA